jgi:lipopolysaccharide assembly outer membrane protein LptD (OstA)
MKMIEGGNIFISKGKSKIVYNNSIFKANLITYNRCRDSITAYGNVRIHLQVQKNEFIQVKGNQAKIFFRNQIVQLVGQVIIKYFAIHSVRPYCILYADKICFCNNTLTAYNNVKVITKCGIIKSNNAFFNKDFAIFKQDTIRPTVDILYNNIKVFYEANEIWFYFNENKIIMKGNIEGIIRT